MATVVGRGAAADPARPGRGARARGDRLRDRPHRHRGPAVAAALVVSLALQVGTNYANDYSDGIRGTDSAERRVGPVRLVGSDLARPGR